MPSRKQYGTMIEGTGFGTDKIGSDNGIMIEFPLLGY
jgi:hypothetical protein